VEVDGDLPGYPPFSVNPHQLLAGPFESAVFFPFGFFSMTLFFPPPLKILLCVFLFFFFSGHFLVPVLVFPWFAFSFRQPPPPRTLFFDKTFQPLPKGLLFFPPLCGCARHFFPLDTKPVFPTAQPWFVFPRGESLLQCPLFVPVFDLRLFPSFQLCFPTGSFSLSLRRWVPTIYDPALSSARPPCAPHTIPPSPVFNRTHFVRFFSLFPSVYRPGLAAFVGPTVLYGTP